MIDKMKQEEELYYFDVHDRPVSIPRSYANKARHKQLKPLYKAYSRVCRRCNEIFKSETRHRRICDGCIKRK